jgi:hypothetical protein
MFFLREETRGIREISCYQSRDPSCCWYETETPSMWKLGISTVHFILCMQESRISTVLFILCVRKFRISIVHFIMSVRKYGISTVHFILCVGKLRISTLLLPCHFGGIKPRHLAVPDSFSFWLRFELHACYWCCELPSQLDIYLSISPATLIA